MKTAGKLNAFLPKVVQSYKDSRKGREGMEIPHDDQAVSADKRSFGLNGPLGWCDDYERTQCLRAFGSNLSERHPVMYWCLTV